MRQSILVRPLLARLLILLAFLLAGCGGAATATSGGAATATAPATQAAATASPSRSTAAPAASSASGTAAATFAPATTTASALASVAATSVAATSVAATSAGGSVAATAYPLTVTDDQGARVMLAAKPTHIVSLVPSNTEILYALGAGADLAAGTQYDDYPPAAKGKATIKGLKPSLEVVMAYHPDLVLASPSNAADLLQQLRTLHVPVVYLDPHDFAGVYHDLDLVGQLVDAAPAAHRTISAMQQEVQSVTEKITAATLRPRVFVELDASDPTKIFTVGPGSFIDTMVAMAGGSNIAHAAASEYPQLGLEALVSADPQVIILDDAAFGATAAAVARRPGWATLSAVKEHRVYPIDDALVSRPGPRLADGLAAIAKLLHPGLFK